MLGKVFVLREQLWFFIISLSVGICLAKRNKFHRQWYEIDLHAMAYGLSNISVHPIKQNCARSKDYSLSHRLEKFYFNLFYLLFLKVWNWISLHFMYGVLFLLRKMGIIKSIKSIPWNILQSEINEFSLLLLLHQSLMNFF